MSDSMGPSIDHLEATWRSIADLAAGLSEAEWKLPTGCPGWNVQDNVTHLVDYESRALGRPAPEHVPRDLTHTKNALGENNEIGVDHRRDLPGATVLAEFLDVTAARLAQLRALRPDDLAREMMTPAGKGTLADMLTLRVMDTWSHEQDIRRAVGRPGHEQGPAVTESVMYFARFLPLIVGKRAGAPDGVTIVVDITGVHRCAIEVVDGRARFSDTEAAAPTVTITMPATTFVALVGGRTDAPDDVTVDGDEALGRAIVGHLGFMP